MKKGMSHDGREITGMEYLKQRIADATFTPLGSVPLANDYGSNFGDLIDENITPEIRMRFYEEAHRMFAEPACDLDDAKLKTMRLDNEGDNLFITYGVVWLYGYEEIGVPLL